MSLQTLLPQPTHQVWDREDEISSKCKFFRFPITFTPFLFLLDSVDFQITKKINSIVAKGAAAGALVSAKIAAPPYGQRRGWVPRTEADFGDGGAFPEIPVAQYPLGMGSPENANKKSNALAVQLDQSGKVKYDVIARQGHAKDKIVYSNIN